MTRLQPFERHHQLESAELSRRSIARTRCACLGDEGSEVGFVIVLEAGASAWIAASAL